MNCRISGSVHPVTNNQLKMRRVPRLELFDEYSELRRDRSREGVVLSLRVFPIPVSAARLSRTELILL
jgi:hypothetical protein